jgi:hypothetical protein
MLMFQIFKILSSATVQDQLKFVDSFPSQRSLPVIPLTYFQYQNSDSTFYSVLNVFPFKINLATESLNKCTTIYS